MASKQELIEELKAKGIEVDESTHPATLAKMLRDAELGKPSSDSTEENMPHVPEATTPAHVEGQAPEGYMKMTDVKALIAQALAEHKSDANAPIKLKKVTTHMANVFRIDGKWVVGFRDQNTNPDGTKIDSYIKEKIHAFQKFNEQKREFEAWIELMFPDKTTKIISLTTYIKNRVPVLCTIIKRHQKDVSYVIGEVEKKKEVGDRLVGTGILIDQEVTQYEENFEIKTPDGEVFTLPYYVIN